MMTSCGGSDKMPGMDQPGSEMQTLSKGAMTGSDAEPDEFVIRDQDAFKSFWHNLSGDFVNDESVPEVDFDSFMVVGVMMGQKPSSGYDINIESATVQEDAETLKLNVVRTEPGPSCMNMSVITHPHHIIKIRNYDGAVAFEYDTVVEECN